MVYREQDGHFTHFLYTADDERILRFGTGGFSWSLRDFQGRVLREFRPESNCLQPIRDHIYRGASPIATVTVDENDILSKRHHLSLDHLGSPRYITDGAGNFLSEHKYYPFGEEATRPAQNDLPLKFTGHERDFYADGTNDDLDYMHARFCDPRVGRFLSVDPVLGSPLTPQSWNRYSYVRGNPMVLIDPSGKKVEFADQESKRVFEDYVSELDPESIDYQNVKALKESEIIFVIEASDQGRGNEGSATFDGEKVTLGVDPTGAAELASVESRLAHEIQHGVQIDTGKLGFVRHGKKWVAIFTDIGDEVEAYDAQLRQARPFDLKRGILRRYSKARDRARFLIRSGYEQYHGRENERRFAERISGIPPGSVVNNGTSFYRAPQQ